MAERHCCGTCRYNRRDWTNPQNPDYYCGNYECEYYGCYTAYTDGDDCDCWEED